jgi:hypothetical protein
MIILRPYLSCDKIGKTMSPYHISLMKINSFLVIKTIYEMMGLLNKAECYKCYHKNEFIKYYYNNGNPYMDFLLEYYYTMYVFWMKKGGDNFDYDDRLEYIYNKNKKMFLPDIFESKHTVVYKLYLLHYDNKYYRRCFLSRREQKIEDYNFFINSKPRVLKKGEIYE